MDSQMRLIDELKKALPKYRWMEDPQSGGRVVTCGCSAPQISVEQSSVGHRITITFTDKPKIEWTDETRPPSEFADILPSIWIGLGGER